MRSLRQGLHFTTTARAIPRARLVQTRVASVSARMSTLAELPNPALIERLNVDYEAVRRRAIIPWDLGKDLRGPVARTWLSGAPVPHSQHPPWPCTRD